MIKVKDRLNRFYFVENNNIVECKNRLLEFKTYQRKITISNIMNILKQNNLKKEQEFDDIYLIKNNYIEITVILKSKDNFYYDDEGIKDISLYLSLIESIQIDILNPLDKGSIKIIEAIMKNFNLNIYHIPTKKHYKNIKEVKRILKKTNLLKI